MDCDQLIPEISVLIPAHGNVPYLTSALDSINSNLCAQNVEIILVLDRLDPEYEKIIRAYESKYALKIFESSIPGIVAALNMGIQECSSKYIARLDADDLMTPKRLQEQFYFLENNPRVAVVGSYIEIIDGNSAFVKIKKFPLTSLEISQTILENSPFAHPAVMFRKESVEVMGSYRKFYENSEDYDLWLRLFEKYEFANIQHSLTRYREHDKQVSILNMKKMVFAKEAAIKSKVNRDLGLPDLDILFEDLNQWSDSSFETSVWLYHKFLKRYSWFKAAESMKRKYYFRFSVYFLLSFLVSPKTFIQRIYKFLRHELKRIYDTVKK